MQQAHQTSWEVIQNAWDADRNNEAAIRKATKEIAGATATIERMFEEALVAAVSRAKNIRNDSSGEDIWEAMVATRKLLLLYPDLRNGLRKLESILKLKQDSTNKKIGAAAITGGIVALYAAGFFLGPPAIAGCFLYSWVTAGAASTALGIGGILGGGTALVAGPTAVYNHSSQVSRYVEGSLTSFDTCSKTTKEVFPKFNHETSLPHNCLLDGEDLACGYGGNLGGQKGRLSEKSWR
ncbi:hypothetical protein COCVIDRAFT_20924 [Bipolaris victoriae FI3]|uniref:Uncharacterized protein n=1 Tax=Bipolaris victoriae (strain FI3) TaxID=930091 RepID=W7E544_BIPV3|nr:hypothetical protein COCVIDRAFT_20924 [Bipolaris victoriae FI3]